MQGPRGRGRGGRGTFIAGGGRGQGMPGGGPGPGASGGPPVFNNQPGMAQGGPQGPPGPPGFMPTDMSTSMRPQMRATDMPSGMRPPMGGMMGPPMPHQAMPFGGGMDFPPGMMPMMHQGMGPRPMGPMGPPMPPHGPFPGGQLPGPPPMSGGPPPMGPPPMGAPGPGAGAAPGGGFPSAPGHGPPMGLPGPPPLAPPMGAPRVPMPPNKRPKMGAPGEQGSENPPINDYSQNFVDTGLRPQNYLRDAVLTDRYEEYPKMKELICMKDQAVRQHTTPPYFLKADLRTLKLNTETFGTKFDVILIDPPWDEYARRAPQSAQGQVESWHWQEIMNLEIENIADSPSFVFLWCGAAEGLEAGRHCLNKWGFRRVEDICWIKTNKGKLEGRQNYLQPFNQGPHSVVCRTKEHCLMGLRGSVRRNMDGHVIHTNCDTDVIVSEEPPLGSTEKPAELYEIIERFCLGKRRLELFGEEHNIRDGWVTVGRNLPTSNFRPNVYASHFRGMDGQVYVENTTGGRVPRNAPTLIPTTPEIEESRPKSPPPTHGNRGHR
eukprot:CAMPEP_0202411586 /NCGR_PEP_ID=MMETSP1128-20130828/22327_1 /ASSEMBLY_ACC=CAM_ASM_000463 /TAXON_ID=3047 /ORGANISM="Dunaliella tertiolecta, Strain CCMP1320" /LENGTH=547 /DNA_ID=CAMNT_0049017321 /DNA_START=280 /DNA_END=1923 /DNA_ORIENTATION=-